MAMKAMLLLLVTSSYVSSYVIAYNDEAKHHDKHNDEHDHLAYAPKSMDSEIRRDLKSLPLSPEVLGCYTTYCERFCDKNQRNFGYPCVSQCIGSQVRNRGKCDISTLPKRTGCYVISCERFCGKNYQRNLGYSCMNHCIASSVRNHGECVKG